MHDDTHKRPSRRPPLRETVMDLDRDLLKMLARRTNILDRIRGRQGYLDAREEKELRASWEKYATRMSRDPRLIRQLFSLLQEVTFNPRPMEGEERRPSFNLAPSQRPVDVRIAAPVACRLSRLYLTLAAVSGSACRMNPSLLGDPAVECVKMFNQCATSVAWDEDGTLRAREGGGLSLADKVIYVGENALNFYLLLGQYAGKPSRAKFTGESDLKLADFTPLRRFLPQMGVRFINAIPNSTGLPVRVECSGVLPDLLRIPADLPEDAVLGLCMGAPFWDSPVAFELGDHPAAAQIIEDALSVLLPSGADVTQHGTVLRFTPGPIKTPEEPELGMDLNLAAFLLALPVATGGEVRLAGRWPKGSLAEGLRTLLSQAGISLNITDDSVRATRQHQNNQTCLDASALPQEFAPLALACALLQALRYNAGHMPLLPSGMDKDEVEDLLAHLDMEATEDGLLRPLPKLQDDEESAKEEKVWAAPTPQFAMAYALCAFARPGLKLANPGVMTGLYPAFWNLYNALPCPDLKKSVPEVQHEKPVRRRIIAADQDGTGSGNSAY